MNIVFFFKICIRRTIWFWFFYYFGDVRSIVGPILVGWITVITGNPRAGILSIVVLFIIGGLLLNRVDFKEGERIALKFSEN